MVIQLNEKIWFGKYKGMRLSEIIDSKPKYIDKIKTEYGFDISDESYEYLRYKLGIKKKLSSLGGLSAGEDIWRV